jgi:site-specific DNA-methyltransferase (adenine-specific)
MILPEMAYQGLRLTHGDCLSALGRIPDSSFNLILTDPPYGRDFQSGRVAKAARRPKIANDLRPFTEWLPEAAAKLQFGGCAIIFCRWDSWDEFCAATEAAGLTVKNQIVWDKLNHSTGDLKGSPGARHELAIFATKGRFIFPGKRPQTLGAFKKVAGRKLAHPNEKPVDLMAWLVEHYSPSGGAVLDCFMGVAPVGVACRQLGRQYHGIELALDYYSIAAERVFGNNLFQAVATGRGTL